MPRNCLRKSKEKCYNKDKKDVGCKMSKYQGADKTAEVCTIWSAAAAKQMGAMVEQCNYSNRIIANSGHIVGEGSLASSAGFAAEEVTAETFNLDAILKGEKVRAFTDACENSPIPTHDPVRDVVVVEDGKIVKTGQLKFYKTAERTEKAFRDIKGGEGHYNEVDQMIAPSDQVEGVRDAARIDELKNKVNRPKVAEAAKQVKDKATDRLSHEDVESRPLTKAEAEQLANEAKEGKTDGLHKEIQDAYKTKSTIQQTAKAAVGAAAITTVIAGTINTISCLSKVQNGEMTYGDAMKYILKNTAIAAGDSAIKAGAATASVSLTARVFPELFVSGSVLQSNLTAGAIGGAAVCAVDLVECLVLVAAGKMTMKELEARTGKNIFQTGAGVVGSSIGAAIGAAGGPIGSVIGALVGGLITSVASTIAIENHIEKPFVETMENAKALVDAEEAMECSIRYLVRADEIMEGFKVGLAASEKDFYVGSCRNRKRIAASWAKINAMK